MKFAQVPAEELSQLVSVLTTAAFEPLRPGTPATSRKHWRVSAKN